MLAFVVFMLLYHVGLLLQLTAFVASENHVAPQTKYVSIGMFVCLFLKRFARLLSPSPLPV